MEKLNNNKGVKIAKSVEDVVLLKDLNKEIKSLKEQKDFLEQWIANMNASKQTEIATINTKLQEKKDLKDQILLAFPELEE